MSEDENIIGLDHLIQRLDASQTRPRLVNGDNYFKKIVDTFTKHSEAHQWPQHLEAGTRQSQVQGHAQHSKSLKVLKENNQTM